MKNKYSKITVLFVGLILINLIASKVYKRFDLTEDNRYTLSKATEKIVENVKDIIIVTVYLKGDFPAEFKRLQTETKLNLEELKAVNKNIHYRFVNPPDIAKKLIESGLEPSRL